MNKSRKGIWVVNILLLLVLIGTIVYAFVIQPNQQKTQRLEDYHIGLYNAVQVGTDLCGDRLNREDAAVFNDIRDTFRMHQGMLLVQYNTAYDDMSVYHTPNALLLLGEYCSTRDIPTDYAAYDADSDDKTGQFFTLCTDILYDALGTDSQSMEDVLKEIEADARTEQAAALIPQLTKEDS